MKDQCIVYVYTILCIEWKFYVMRILPEEHPHTMKCTTCSYKDELCSLVPRPIPSFPMFRGTCNIEKLGMGLGDKAMKSVHLHMVYYSHGVYHTYTHYTLGWPIFIVLWTFTPNLPLWREMMRGHGQGRGLVGGWSAKRETYLNLWVTCKHTCTVPPSAKILL